MAGDNIYADTTDMDVMQAKYAKLKSDPGFGKLMKSCPILATWDDHDYGANDAGADYDKRIESQRIFVDFWGDPADSPRRHRPGVYEAYRFGPAGKPTDYSPGCSRRAPSWQHGTITTMASTTQVRSILGE